jgi:hypothetical protein
MNMQRLSVKPAAVAEQSYRGNFPAPAPRAAGVGQLVPSVPGVSSNPPKLTSIHPLHEKQAGNVLNFLSARRLCTRYGCCDWMAYSADAWSQRRPLLRTAHSLGCGRDNGVFSASITNERQSSPARFPRPRRPAEGTSQAKIPLLAACCRCYTAADYFWESRAMEGGR